MDKYIDENYLHEKSKLGYSPWMVLIQEAQTKNLKEVHSDDSEDLTTRDINQDVPAEPEQEAQEEVQEEEEVQDPILSDEDFQNFAAMVNNGELTEEDIKKMIDSKEISTGDIQKLQEEQPQEELTPEEVQFQQINQVQEMVIRFSIYDKIMKLDEKLELFQDNFNDVNSDFFRDTIQIHEYIKVLNTLIFNLEINLVYQLYTSLELNLIELFNDYLENKDISDKGIK